MASSFLRGGMLPSVYRRMTVAPVCAKPYYASSLRHQFSSTSSESSAPAVIPATASSSSPAIQPLSKSATAGLSEASLIEWRERVAKGEGLSTIWENPGAYGQLGRLNSLYINSLPPPPRPQWPQSEWSYTWRYLKAFGVALLFAGLAGFIQAKQRVQGGVRWQLQHSSPGLIRLLIALNVIQDDRHLQEDLDRPSLFSRVFNKYADKPATAAAAPSIPLARAVVLMSAILGNPELPSDTVPVDARVQSALQAVGISAASTQTLSAPQFLLLANAVTADMSPGLLTLGCSELFGVAYASPHVLDALGELFDRVVALRSDGAAFTAAQLCEICNDIGFSATEEQAASALSQYPSGAPMSRAAFIDFMASALMSAQIDEARVSDYLRVYYLLHTSGMKTAAGVPQLK